MKKSLTIMMVGMFLLVGCGSIVSAEDDDPVGANRAPYAPVFIGDAGDWEKECYMYSFYAEDPDGDDVLFDISWEQTDDPTIYPCSPDDPVAPWLGPYGSGEEVEQTHNCYQSGNYQLTVRAKDIHGNIGPATTISVTYKESKFIQLLTLSQMMQNHPILFNLLAKIF